MKTRNALVIVVDGVEEVEATAPIDILRRAEVEVTVASAAEQRTITGRNQIRLVADCLLEEVDGMDFDLLVIPGGPGYKVLMEHSAVLDRIKRQRDQKRLIGSICAGPVVLKTAGVLKGHRFTSFPGTGDVLPDRITDQPVVVDGNLITSQGAGTAVPFGLALVDSLCGGEKRRQIAESICFSG